MGKDLVVLHSVPAAYSFDVAVASESAMDDGDSVVAECYYCCYDFRYLHNGKSADSHCLVRDYSSCSIDSAVDDCVNSE